MAKDSRTDERIPVIRVPVSGNRDVLTVYGKEPGFEYRWILDKGNRTNKFKKGGWEFVTHEVEVGDARAATPSALGSIVEATTGSDKLVLMRIPSEYYKEDQDSKEANIRAVEEAMGKEIEGSYGSINISK